MKVFFSTVVRSAPRERGGEFVQLDWESKTVEGKVPIFPTNPDLLHDPNPRGNTRGGRGIEFLDDKVVVASYHTLKIYDRELHHQGDVSHPLMVGLHEIYSNARGRIWVTSTAIDAALEFDMETGQISRQYWPREMPGFQQALGLMPLEIDRQADNRDRFLGQEHQNHPHHLHLNAVVSWQGEMYAFFHHFGVIANLDRDEVVIKDPELYSGHSMIIQDDGTAIVNHTRGRTVRIYDLKAKKLKQVIDITEFRWVRDLAKWQHVPYFVKGILGKFGVERYNPPPRPLFVRGLDVVGDWLFVGLSPASILCIDSRRGELIDAYCYSRDVDIAVHGLKVLAG